MSTESGAVRRIVPERAVMWAGHYSTYFLLAAVATSVGYDAAGRQGGIPAWASSAAWLAWMITWAADGRHSERLCERCIAGSPLDPQAAVNRWRRVLRLHHANGAITAALVLVFAWDIAGGLMRESPWWALALDGLAAAALGASYAVTWMHRRLYPWCPFCDWDEGGEHEASPDVPAPSAAR